MAISFDAATQRINLSAGTVALNVRDLYSKRKEWVQVADNAKYFPAFSVTGGDTIDAGAGTSVPCYAFLLNGWRIKPQEANHTLAVTGGVLLVSGGGDPFVDTTGSFVVRVNYSQPVQAITVSTGGGSGISAADVWAYATRSLTASLDPTAATIAAAILAAAQATPIHANMMQTNSEAIIGTGTAINKFRSHLVP